MNGLLNSWMVRALIVAGGTYLVYKHAPLSPTGRTVALAIGGVSTALVVAANVPVVNNLLSGQLSLSAPAA